MSFTNMKYESFNFRGDSIQKNMNLNHAKNRGRIKILTTNKPPKAPGLPQIHSRNSLSNEENIINFRTFDVSNNRTRGIQRPQI